MLHFECDYACGAAEPVMRALLETNCDQTVGYGEDEYCEEARALILDKCAAPDAAVHFFVGGTQVNATVIASVLRPYEGVLSPDCGHINVHETGAVEATGHKVLALPSENGKLKAESIRRAMEAHLSDSTHEHMVRPGMVYLSYPTELGTLYTKEEFLEISAVCREFGLPLYVDGARLCYALAAQPEVDLPFLAQVCSAFTIGGTKAGLLFGEALVVTDPALNTCFRYHLKQRGAMLAKGRLLGVQFKALLENDYYLGVAECANGLAQQIKMAFMEHGCPLLCDTITNQVFPIVPDAVLDKLKDKYRWSFWERVDDTHSAVRFCANVTTPMNQVVQLLGDLETAFAEGDA